MELEVAREVSCPYCGEPFTTFIDTSLPAQEYTEDCQICCRPILLTVRAKPGRVLSLESREEN